MMKISCVLLFVLFKDVLNSELEEEREEAHQYEDEELPFSNVKPLTVKQDNYITRLINGTAMCSVKEEPCGKDEGRRVDGTCINPKYPSRGAVLTPFLRLLPPMFGPGHSIRPSANGSELPSARVIRTALLTDGVMASHDFTHLISHFMLGIVGDIVDLFYIFSYMIESDCCINNKIPNEANPMCMPIKVPADDPYLRRAGVRCMNLTRVETYQDYGCLPRSVPVERYSRVTPVLDLSIIYGNTEERAGAIRAKEGGLLAFRMEGDREVPAGQAPWCINNRPPLETSCYGFGDEYHGNLFPGTVLFSLWFFREHNRLARKLAAINKCWDDDKIYQTARQINIASWQNIVYYELFAGVLGQKNLAADGVLYDTPGYVNDFDTNHMPGVYREFTIGLRWFHTFLSGINEMYSGHQYTGHRTQVDDILRSGIFALNNTEGDLTQGALIQPEDDLDHFIDNDIAERLYGDLQAAADLPAIDMMRGRDAGLPPYNHYRELCGMNVVNKFEDFEVHIRKEQVEILQRLYHHVDDVELMVAIYSEKFLPNSYVGPTLYCIIVHNLVNWRKSDKYFFEHGGFSHALTIEQLQEVRKTSIARYICDNGEKVNMIQRHAFFRKKSWNPFVSCDKIPGINLNKWKDNCLPAKQKGR